MLSAGEGVWVFEFACGGGEGKLTWMRMRLRVSRF